MRTMLKGVKLLTRVVARAQRQQLVTVEQEMNALIDMVDRFYDILGPRHWIFTDHLLPVSDVGKLVAASPTSEAAEAGLIEIVANRIRSPYWHLGLFGHEAMRARRANLERARQHYLQEQWDSCALVLITVMDGFVNDVEKANRRGLHTRGPEEMVAWDSVSGHHMGLTSVMRVFLKTFKRRQDEEVFELHRHGVVHGTVVNYNNQTVATKAWNMLAAVADWTAAKEKASIAAEPKPTLRSTVALLLDHAERSRYRSTFEPSTVAATEAGFGSLEAVQVALTFLESWQAQRWGLVAEALPIIGGAARVASGNRAVEAKQIYGNTRLGEFEITAAQFPQASVAVIYGTATIGGTPGSIEIRWIYEGADGHLARPGDVDARWVLAIYPPDTFIKEGEGLDAQP
jgi:hypothetical protein